MTVTAGSQEVPIEIVGSSTFGRYPTISASRTYNMFISASQDGKEQWLVNFAGYEALKVLVGGTVSGRGIFTSTRGGFLIAVVGNAVFRLDTISSAPVQVGTLSSSTGEVSIDENLSSQICIVDGAHAYIYNYSGTPSFGDVVFDPASPDFTPNYVCFQNTYFIFGNANETPTGNKWFIYEGGSGQTLTYHVELALQTKPDYALAVVPVPSHSNTLLVLGSTVCEIWTALEGVSLQTYKRNTSVNIDYGCASVSTIARSDEFVAWLGINDKSAPCIMVMAGGEGKRISSDGIDNLLGEIQFPEQSTAFFFRQDGHVFYQLTFFNPADNLTLAYDFTTGKFFDLYDFDATFHPARQIAYFQKKLYFVSLKDGLLFETSTDITQYITYPGLDERDIPRIRTTNTFRLPGPEKFRVNLFTFTIESGTNPFLSELSCQGYIITEGTEEIIYTEEDLPLITEAGDCRPSSNPRVDLTISKNSGLTWSNTVPYVCNKPAHYQSQPRFSRLGVCNTITLRLRFWNQGRVVVKDGLIEVSP